MQASESFTMRQIDACNRGEWPASSGTAAPVPRCYSALCRAMPQPHLPGLADTVLQEQLPPQLQK